MLGSAPSYNFKMSFILKVMLHLSPLELYLLRQMQTKAMSNLDTFEKHNYLYILALRPHLDSVFVLQKDEDAFLKIQVENFENAIFML